ncbi:MAG: hemerythrin domain-containing protein [Kofleriaceae bacterium]|nr:hemerythrin domain-containing protein [Kofleriaceae bacterium]MCB9573899.1 hemerythrin domain-containing protein [Kofleriaceae bacterium]
MTTPRVDLYTPIHKALRRLLSTLADDVAGADRASADHAETIHARVTRAVDFLDEHAHHEDRHLEPRLIAADPDLAEALAATHRALHPRHVALRVRAAAFARAGDATRAALGAALRDDVLAVVEAQFLHMRQEEVEGNAALWRAFDDDALIATRAALQADIPLPRYLEWVAIMLPAWSTDECGAMLRAVRGAAPPAVADAIFAVARDVLGPTWAELSPHLAAA